MVCSVLRVEETGEILWVVNVVVGGVDCGDVDSVGEVAAVVFADVVVCLVVEGVVVDVKSGFP